MLMVPVVLTELLSDPKLECLEYQKDLSRQPLPVGELAVLEGFYSRAQVVR